MLKKWAWFKNPPFRVTLKYHRQKGALLQIEAKKNVIIGNNWGQSKINLIQ
jgi:hypothetical protein